MSEQGANPAESGSVEPRSSVWGRFREEREARGLSIADISAFLKLAPRQVDALERGDIAVLPGAAFARGFVRNYARFLELDPAPFLAAIDSRIPEVQSRTVERIPSTEGLGKMPTRRGTRFSALPAALVSIALLVVLSAGWYFQWFEPREENDLLAAASNPRASSSATASEPAPAESIPSAGAAAVTPEPVAASSAPSSFVSAPAPAAPATSVVQSAPVTVPTTAAVTASTAPSAVTSGPSVLTNKVAPGSERLVLSFEGDAWVEVKDGYGKVIFSKLNPAGATQEIHGNGPLKVVVGNAPKVKVSWKGQSVDLTPYTKVSVARLTLE